MTINILASAASLPDDELLARLAKLAANERHASVELVAHLTVLAERPNAFAALGFTSLFEYCTVVLRLSEDAACTRIAVAGACRRFPVILDLLASGATNLTNVRRLAGKLTPENHEAVLARAVYKCREDVEKLIRELDPLPDLRGSIRRVATPTPRPQPQPAANESAGGGLDFSAASPAPELRPEPRPSVRPSAPERYHVRLTFGERARMQLLRAQTLLRREIPDGDLEAIFERALDLLVEDLEKKTFGRTKSPGFGQVIRPGTDHPAARRSRHIPNAVKRAVSDRDGDQCGFVAADGRRCAARAYLEFHHVRPFALDGPPTVENISLRCRRHNQYEADLVFGPHGASEVGEPATLYGRLGAGIAATWFATPPSTGHARSPEP